ncbi:MAG: GDP-mannose 4,6-dehydratase [Candidatus Obscuribacterales bacterium]|jgi:UDP-glucose 4-epimerase|nr:GDP-mannose 4,6-dehydratase [Candidatus Obscuribacterales bacterium]
MRITGKKILLTGGAGFIGSNLVEVLLNNGNSVIVLDDFSTGKKENLKNFAGNSNLEIVDGSILDYPLVCSLVSQCDVIFHLAVQCLRLSFTNPTLVHEVNATGTLNLLRACVEGVVDPTEFKNSKKKRIERFIYVSSSEVYGSAKTAPMTEEHLLEPTTVYGASKLAGELYTLAHFHSWGMPTVVIRPFNSYGFNEHWEGASGEVIPRFAARIMSGLPPIVFGDGEQTRDFTFVSETAKGMFAVAECDEAIGRCINVAYGQEVSIKRIASLLLEKLGRTDLKIEYLPERPGDVRRHYADVRELEKLTGFRPSIKIEEGLDLFLQWFEKEVNRTPELISTIETKNWK